jgi:spore maturation protein CgeB
VRVLILNADYPNFLRELYLDRPGLADRSYGEQMAVRNDSLFGVADFYSRNFRAHGHEAVEIHLNNHWLQYAWAREHGLDLPPLMPPPRRDETAPAPGMGAAAVLKSVLRPFKPLLAPVARRVRHRLARLRRPAVAGIPGLGRTEWEQAVLRAQIADFKPDLILNQELAYLPSPFFRDAKPKGCLLFGQIASSMPDDDFALYDMMISSLPNQVEWFRKRGLRAELNRLAFDPVVLERLGPQPARDIALSFVGSLSPDHKSRIAFLEHVARHTPLKVWGNGIERLPQSSPLHACYQGEAWGRAMYEVIRRSCVTLNFHIDLADGWANNMRLYEATGAGALLLTDWKKNLHEMFVPGEHVATYQDAKDCVARIGALLADDATRSQIAAAGQQQAIQNQNYYRRVGEIIALAEKLRSAA